MSRRAELDDIRARNRARLGLAGLGAGFDPAAALGLMSGTSVRVRTAFPDADLQFEPGQDQPTGEASSAGVVGDLLLRHVVRPEGSVTVGGQTIAWAPYRSYADWSGVAKAVAAIFGVGVIAGTAYVFWRAFSPRRSNPRRLLTLGRAR